MGWAAGQASQPFGPPDILVNCAGLNLRPPLAEVTIEAFDELMAVNLTAPFLLGQRYGSLIGLNRASRVLLPVGAPYGGM